MIVYKPTLTNYFPTIFINGMSKGPVVSCNTLSEG